MEITIAKMILAAVTTAGDRRVEGCPVFNAADEAEAAEMCLVLSRVLEGVAHDMGNGVYIIVKH